MGLTQSALCSKARISRATLTRAEGGEAIRAESARRIAKALGVKLETLVDSDAAAGATVGPLGEATHGERPAAKVVADAGDGSLCNVMGLEVRDES